MNLPKMTAKSENRIVVGNDATQVHNLRECISVHQEGEAQYNQERIANTAIIEIVDLAREI
jgi:hypothetical protein